MPRTTTLMMVVVLVIGSVSAFPVAAAAQSGSPIAAAIGGPTHAQVNENASETAANVTAGERLSAVVGVSQAEFEGEVEQRAYGIAYAKANTDDAKAEVVAERLTDIEGRLAELEQEREELEAAHENGSIGDGEFQARMTALAARTESVEQLANASEARAGELPADVLEANGVNVSAIQQLKQHADELSGDKVAEIARSIAGPDVGQSVSQGPPEDVGVPSPDQARDGARGGDAGGDGREAGDAGDGQAAIDRAAEQVDAAQLRLEQVEQRVNDSDAGENATDAVASARDELEQAQQALADARAAMEAGDDEAAAAHVEDAMNHAEQAESNLEDALEAIQTAGSDDGDGDRPTEAGDGGGYP